MSLFKRKSNAIILKPALSEFDKAMQTIQKFNSMYSQQMGIGDPNSDPIENMTVIESPVFGTQARQLRRNLDLMQQIIDGPSNDALKNGWEITTNVDHIFDLSSLLNKRSEELKLKEAARQFGINSRMYSKGAFLHPVVCEYEETPKSEQLSWYNVEKIEALNLAYEEHVTYICQVTDPFSKGYGNIKQAWLLGSPIHPSRYFLHVLSLDPFIQRGISILDRVKRAVFGINIANWTVTEIMRRYGFLIVGFDPKSLMQMTGEQRNNATSVIGNIAKWATSKSVVPVPNGQTFEYVQRNVQDIDKAIGTLKDFLAAVTRIPQRKMFGSAAGELAAADTDERQYHEMLESELHEMTFAPMMQFVYKYMLHERSGVIFKKLWQNNIDPDEVTINIEFNPIASVNPMTEAQINLMKSQTDATDIQAGVISADMARKERFPEMADEVVPEPDFDMETIDYTSNAAMDKIKKLKEMAGVN